MVLVEFTELTGYDVSNLDYLKNRVKGIKRVEYNNGVLVLYFDEVRTAGPAGILTDAANCSNE